MLDQYGIKIDDALLYLLKEYHNISASDALTFFAERVEETKELQPNITEKSRPATIGFKTLDRRTVQTKWTSRNNYAMRKSNPYNDSMGKYYVLRGFYPETNLPFKMTVVRAGSNDGYGMREKGDVLYCKVIMGMKPHWSTFNSSEVETYREEVAEAVLLDKPLDKIWQIPYNYREFKCMRPKGMELYHERNHEEKRKEKARVAAAKRKQRKKDDKK